MKIPCSLEQGIVACRKSPNNKFLHTGRLREMELNFVLLRVGAVRWYRPRAKNGKCLKAAWIRCPSRL